MANPQAPAPGPVVGSGKAFGAVIGGALATIVIYIIQQVTKQPLPADISAAVQTLLVTGIVYFTPHDLGSR